MGTRTGFGVVRSLVVALALAAGGLGACTYYNGIAVREDGTVLMTVSKGFLFYHTEVWTCRPLEPHQPLTCVQVHVVQSAGNAASLQAIDSGPVQQDRVVSTGSGIRYVDADGDRIVDPAALVDVRVEMHLTDGTVRRVRIVEVSHGIVVEYRGSRFTYSLSEIDRVVRLDSQ